jgi:Uma2 family endonuclease
VARQNLGFVFRPRAVLRYRSSEVEPDLVVRAAGIKRATDWDKAPKPILIIEILSPSTRRRDLEIKREFYMKSRIPEYWIGNPQGREVIVASADKPDLVTSDVVEWAPPGISVAPTIRVSDIFGGVRN